MDHKNQLNTNVQMNMAAGKHKCRTTKDRVNFKCHVAHENNLVIFSIQLQQILFYIFCNIVHTFTHVKSHLTPDYKYIADLKLALSTGMLSKPLSNIMINILTGQFMLFLYLNVQPKLLLHRPTCRGSRCHRRCCRRSCCSCLGNCQ